MLHERICALTVRLLRRTEIRRLAKARLSARANLGQELRADASTVRRVVAASGVSRSDLVLEVGPGAGSLALALLVRRDLQGQVGTTRRLPPKSSVLRRPSQCARPAHLVHAYRQAATRAQWRSVDTRICNPQMPVKLHAAAGADPPVLILYHRRSAIASAPSSERHLSTKLLCPPAWQASVKQRPHCDSATAGVVPGLSLVPPGS